MRIQGLLKYVTIAGEALLSVACDGSPGVEPQEAGIELLLSPADLPAGMPPTGTRPPTPPPPPETVPLHDEMETVPLHDEMVSPHPRRAVPERVEIAPRSHPALPPMPAPPARPTHQDSAPVDGMPVLEQPVHDGMHPIVGHTTDPMPVITPPLAQAPHESKPEPAARRVISRSVIN
jgi:hypothetical protein